jgi:hypothetical protein
MYGQFCTDWRPPTIHKEMQIVRKYKTRALFLMAVLGAALGAGVVSAQTEPAPPPNCDGRKSWLTGKCTYCEWGGSCGACQISGCG